MSAPSGGGAGWNGFDASGELEVRMFEKERWSPWYLMTVDRGEYLA